MLQYRERALPDWCCHLHSSQIPGCCLGRAAGEEGQGQTDRNRTVPAGTEAEDTNAKSLFLKEEGKDLSVTEICGSQHC